jgi:hypothetical protein
MSTREERIFVKSCYPNETWAEKVDRMDDAQLLAVYFRLKEHKPVPEIDQAPKIVPPTQLSLFKETR